MATAKGTPAKKGVARKGAAAKPSAKKPGTRAVLPKSMPKAGKDPMGGLTAAGRAFFNKRDGTHLRPGVKGAADTPEKMKRKGSFLTRHFTHPRGPMIDEKGEPTRLALSAHAWGEPVPKTEAAGKRLAAKGRKLLEQFHEARGDAPGKAAAKKTPFKKSAVTKSAVTKSAAKKSAVKKSGAKAAERKSALKTTVGGKTAARKAAGAKATASRQTT